MKPTVINLLLTLGSASLLASAEISPSSTPDGFITPSNKPNKNQASMIARRYGMFIHFGINTYSGKEWTDGTLPPDIYNPTELNTDQWAKTARDAGMSYIILITKHHDGFCLWDSPHTNYDVGSSPVKTDVLKAMAASCKKHGIKLGFYYSLWDRNWANGAMRGKPSRFSKKQSDAYVNYMKKQLAELLTHYGDICELWLDGGWVLPRKHWQIAQIYHHVKQLQPRCLVGVNWTIGQFNNPDFHAVRPPQYRKGQPIRYFPSDFRLGDPMLPEFPDVKLFAGPDKQLYYLPFETTVCLNKHWFWQPYDKKLLSVQKLLPLYERSTSQDNVLILNSPPNRKGLMDGRNIQRLKELAHALGATPGKTIPENLSESATATADSVRENNKAQWGASGATDGNPSTRWASATTTASLTLTWSKPQKINFLRAREYTKGQPFRIESFTIEALINKRWHTIQRGTAIGINKIIPFKPVTTTALRLNILKASKEPSLQYLAAGYR